jgi:hypothetical protein
MKYRFIKPQEAHTEVFNPTGDDGALENKTPQNQSSWLPVSFVLLSFPYGYGQKKIIKETQRFLRKISWRSQCHLLIYYGWEVSNLDNPHVHLVIHVLKNEVSRWRRRTEDFEISKAFNWYATMDEWNPKFASQGYKYVGVKHHPTSKGNKLFSGPICPGRGRCKKECLVPKRIKKIKSYRACGESPSPWDLSETLIFSSN